MTWNVKYLQEAEKDLMALDGNQRILVRKAIRKVSQNPLSTADGGFGKPLGNHSGTRLSGFLKIKLKDAGIRIVYKVIRTETELLVIVIGAREDDKVYEQAQDRAIINNLYD